MQQIKLCFLCTVLAANPESLVSMLDYTCYHPGSFDQCSGVVAESEGNEVLFQGQYFLASALPDQKLVDMRGLEDGLPSEHFVNGNGLSIRQKLGALFRYPKYFKLKTGVCLPSTCSHQDAVSLLNQSKEKTL